MYAIIEVGGKQHKVAPGDVIYTETFGANEGESVEFKPLAWHNERELSVEPAEKVKVKANVVKNGKARKITVFTYKPKKNSKRKMGHRQNYTKLEIVSIG